MERYRTEESRREQTQHLSHAKLGSLGKEDALNEAGKDFIKQESAKGWHHRVEANTDEGSKLRRFAPQDGLFGW